MGRIANFANTIRRSGARLGPLDALFAVGDYADGKQNGEDDTRAIAGAAGSTLGGWGGAAAGGMTGAAIGSVVPFVGTAIGGAIGAIAGGTLGGFAGGWGADRVDETIRGNKQMQHYDRNGKYLGDDGQPEPQSSNDSQPFSPQPDYVTPIGNVAAGVGVTTAGVQTAKNLARNGTNPSAIYNTAKGMGLNSGEAVNIAGRSMLSDAGRAMKGLSPLVKGAGILGAGYLLNEVTGNPLGKFVDWADGHRTNFSNNPEEARKQQQLQQLTVDQKNGYAQQKSNAQVEQMNLDPYNRFIEQQTDKAYKRQKEDYWQQHNVERGEQLENSRYNLSATLGRDLMNNWYNSADRVNNAMQTIGRASFL